MNKYLYILVFLGVSQLMWAQGKDKDKQKDVFKKSAVLREVKTNMKAANYSKALDEVNKAFGKYAEAREDAELHSTSVRILEQQALQENKNMYLASRPDTAKYFNCLYRMYMEALTCDSLEQITDLDIKPNIRYRYDNAAILLKYRQNLKVSSKFFYKKKDYVKAYEFTDLYCRTKNDPVFTGKKGDFLLKEDNDGIEMSIMAVLSAYGSKNYQGVRKYLDKSLEAKSYRYQFLELGTKSYMALGDTVKALELAKDGFTGNPSQEFFFITLEKYNNDKDDHNACLFYVNEMVKRFPENRNYWFIKAHHEEVLEMNEQAIESNRKAIEAKNDDAEAYSAIGGIYSKMAQKLYDSNTLSVTQPGYREFRANLKELYRKAKDAYESARTYAPDNKTLWKEGLRNTYFRLNMGKELKELERN